LSIVVIHSLFTIVSESNQHSKFVHFEMIRIIGITAIGLLSIVVIHSLFTGHETGNDKEQIVGSLFYVLVIGPLFSFALITESRKLLLGSYIFQITIIVFTLLNTGLDILGNFALKSEVFLFSLLVGIWYLISRNQEPQEPMPQFQVTMEDGAETDGGTIHRRSSPILSRRFSRKVA